MLLLHKLLPAFLLPLAFCLGIVLLGLLLRRRALVLAGAGFLYLSSIGLVSGRLLRMREAEYPLIPRESCPTADAIVVLSGTLGQNPGAHDGFYWTEGVNRVEQGVKLFLAGKARQLIFTAGRTPWLNEPRTEAEILREIAIERGVPATAISITALIENTAGEAAAVTALARERQIRSVILVTTAWHMPRAYFLFQQTGLQITPYPVGQRVNQTDGLTVLDFVPSAKALLDSEIALREMMGTAFYRVRR